MTFTKTLTMAVAALTLGAAVATTSAPAEAKGGRNAAIAAGIVGGLAFGALAAGAAGHPGYGYAEPVYAECFWVKRRYVNHYGELVVTRERVCE